MFMIINLRFVKYTNKQVFKYGYMYSINKVFRIVFKYLVKNKYYYKCKYLQSTTIYTIINIQYSITPNAQNS